MTIQAIESHLIQRPRSASDSARTDKAILLAVAAGLVIALVTLGLLTQPVSDADGSYGRVDATVAMVGL